MQLTCIYFLHMVQCTCCWSQMPCCPQRRTTFFLQMFMRKNRKRKAETAVTKPSSKSAKLDSVSSQSSTSSSSKDWSTDRWPTVLSGASGLIHLIQMWWNLKSCVRWWITIFGIILVPLTLSVSRFPPLYTSPCNSFGHTFESPFDTQKIMASSALWPLFCRNSCVHP